MTLIYVYMYVVMSYSKMYEVGVVRLKHAYVLSAFIYASFSKCVFQMQMHIKAEKYIRLQYCYIRNLSIIRMKYFCKNVTD